MKSRIVKEGGGRGDDFVFVLTSLLLFTNQLGGRGRRVDTVSLKTGATLKESAKTLLLLLLIVFDAILATIEVGEDCEIETTRRHIISNYRVLVETLIKRNISIKDYKNLPEIQEKIRQINSS